MKPTITIRQALEDPNLLGATLAGSSWKAWRTLLIATMGEPLRPDEMEIFARLTSRDVAPSAIVEEFWAIVGRRGGKTRAMAVLATYLAALVDWRDRLAPGETGTLLLIAPDMRQASVALNYIRGAFSASPLLAQMIAGETSDTLSLKNGIEIEVRAASFRRLRGMTAIAILADEAAFWRSDESSNPDTEILNACRPMLATTGGILVVISSPYAKKGEVYSTYRRDYGAKGDAPVLVARGASRDFNPSLSERIVARAMERDAAAASAEYLGQFRNDIESFVSREVVEQCVVPGRHELPPAARFRYNAFCDPSGGSSDSMTIAIAHREGDLVVSDALREAKPPFSPDGVVIEFSELLRQYKISSVHGDKYGGDWVAERFRDRQIRYEHGAKPKSDLYKELLPLLNAGRIELLDDPRLLTQLCSLERRTARSGRDSIDAPGHEDIANACAGVAAMVAGARGRLDYAKLCTM